MIRPLFLRLRLIVLIALVAGPALAVSQQELNSLRISLREFQIHVSNEELAKLNAQQRVQLTALMESGGFGSYRGTQQRITKILNAAGIE